MASLLCSQNARFAVATVRREKDARQAQAEAERARKREEEQAKKAAAKEEK